MRFFNEIVCVCDSVLWQYSEAALSNLLKAACFSKLNLPLMMGRLSMNSTHALSLRMTLVDLESTF